MFITDDKLPDDVVRKRYSDRRHTLCCLDCGYEAGFDPSLQGSIGRPLYDLLKHNCPIAQRLETKRTSEVPEMPVHYSSIDCHSLQLEQCVSTRE